MLSKEKAKSIGNKKIEEERKKNPKRYEAVGKKDIVTEPYPKAPKRKK